MQAARTFGTVSLCEDARVYTPCVPSGILCTRHHSLKVPLISFSVIRVIFLSPQRPSFPLPVPSGLETWSCFKHPRDLPPPMLWSSPWSREWCVCKEKRKWGRKIQRKTYEESTKENPQRQKALCWYGSILQMKKWVGQLCSAKAHPNHFSNQGYQLPASNSMPSVRSSKAGPYWGRRCSAHQPGQPAHLSAGHRVWP